MQRSGSAAGQGEATRFLDGQSGGLANWEDSFEPFSLHKDESMSLSLEEAKVIALEYARRHLAIEVDLAVVESQVFDLGHAWRIPYNSSIFLERPGP